MKNYVVQRRKVMERTRCEWLQKKAGRDDKRK